jgi:hypothetical protein
MKTYKISKESKKTITGFLDTHKGDALISLLYAYIEEDFVQQGLIDTGMIKLYPSKPKNPDVIFKSVLKRMVATRKKNKGAESNEECIDVDCLTELLSKMTLVQFRKLQLEKLLTI